MVLVAWLQCGLSEARTGSDIPSISPTEMKCVTLITIVHA